MRPSFVTDEDIARWDENIDSDETLQEVGLEFTTEPVLRELLYASLWLDEGLRKLGLDEMLILNIQQVMGKESYGADPWQVAQVMIEIYSGMKSKSIN